MIFSLNILLVSTTILFLFGFLGLIINKKNLLLILLSLELMLLSINLNFIFFSVYLDDIVGQIFAIYVLTVAAAESAIGLAIFTLFFKDKKTLFLDNFLRTRG